MRVAPCRSPRARSIVHQRANGQTRTKGRASWSPRARRAAERSEPGEEAPRGFAAWRRAQSPPLILEERVHERADVDRSPAARQVVARARVEAGEGGVA